MPRTDITKSRDNLETVAQVSRDVSSRQSRDLVSSPGLVLEFKADKKCSGIEKYESSSCLYRGIIEVQLI